MIDEVTKARLAIGLPSNRFYDAGDNEKCPLSGVKLSTAKLSPSNWHF